MSTKPRRRSALTALFAAAIALLLALPGLASADPLGSVTTFKAGFRGTAFTKVVTAGPDGNVWFVDPKTFAGTSAIGRITPSDEITEFVDGENLSGLNGGSDLVAITAAPSGSELWFTDKGATPAIGVISTASPETATEYSAGLNAGAKPEGIVAGPDGNLWFADGGSTPAIGKINPTTHVIEEFSAGLNPGSAPRGIAAGPDGNLWFTDGGTPHAIGKINPGTGAIEEFATGAGSEPGGTNAEIGPWGIAPGSDGNVWYTEAKEGAPAICRITPSGTITCFSEGLNEPSGPLGLTAGPNGKLWFSDNLTPTSEIQTFHFSGATEGQVFTLCNEDESKCETFEYKLVSSSGTRTTLRNRVRAAMEAVYGEEAVLTGGPSSTTCGGNCTVNVTFSEEGPLVNTDVGQTSCTTAGAGSCEAETIENGIEKGLGSITTSGTITRYKVAGLASIAGIAYSGGNVWAAAGYTELSKILKFGIEAQTLNVSKTGSGTGTVTSSPSGINCGSECSKEYISGEEVTLEASADPGSEFTGWTGCTSEEAGKCKVAISGVGEVNVTANFDLEGTGPTNRRTLTITKSAGGTGGVGSVSSKPAGIKCSTGCTKAVGSFYETGPTPSNVVLTAKPANGSTFVEWTGACSGASLTCTVSITEDKSVGAVFGGLSKAIAEPTALTVDKGESEENRGHGTVKASGLYCEADCTETTVLYQGTITLPKPKAAKTVELSQTPAFGSEFAGWSGCDKVEAGKCFVTMSAAKAVTAEYNAKPNVALTIQKNAEGGNYTSGTGTVTSKPKGLKCATTCTTQTMAVPSGEAVVLKAKAATGMTFTGWSGGGCSGAAETCTVSPTSATKVTASFSGAPKAIAEAQALTLAKAGTGFGNVKATGLACEALCTSATSLYAGTVTLPKPKAATTVTLEAIPALGSKAVVWSGCDTETEGKCVVQMSTAKAVTATFDELE
jgi:streptogramin lyase